MPLEEHGSYYFLHYVVYTLGDFFQFGCHIRIGWLYLVGTEDAGVLPLEDVGFCPREVIFLGEKWWHRYRSSRGVVHGDIPCSNIFKLLPSFVGVSATYIK